MNRSVERVTTEFLEDLGKISEEELRFTKESRQNSACWSAQAIELARSQYADWIRDATSRYQKDGQSMGFRIVCKFERENIPTIRFFFGMGCKVRYVKNIPSLNF